MLGKSAKQTGTGKDKWSQPGWRIEQKYANKVLIGNWAEERLQVSSFKKAIQNGTIGGDEEDHFLGCTRLKEATVKCILFSAFDSYSSEGLPVYSTHGDQIQILEAPFGRGHRLDIKLIHVSGFVREKGTQAEVESAAKSTRMS